VNIVKLLQASPPRFWTRVCGQCQCFKAKATKDKHSVVHDWMSLHLGH